VLNQERSDPQGGNLDRIVIKTDGRWKFLDYDDIYWIEAAANYVRIHADKDAYLVRDTIGAVEHKIDPRDFSDPPLHHCQLQHVRETGAVQ